MIFLIDFVTLSLATDNAHWSRVPDIWQINKLATIATIMGGYSSKTTSYALLH
jgi:hypothetical protein